MTGMSPRSSRSVRRATGSTAASSACDARSSITCSAGEELVEQPFQRLIAGTAALDLEVRRLLERHGHVQGQDHVRSHGGARRLPVEGVEVRTAPVVLSFVPIMLKLLPQFPSDRPLRLLCIGAHSDDLEIGCGGTVPPGWRRGLRST